MDGFVLGRIRGIELRVNWSVVVIGMLISWSLADSVLPDQAAGRSQVLYWVVGAVTAAAFLVGLVAHELGHSVVAQRNGVGVRSITLWLFGGVAELDAEPEDPAAALRIAAAGPAVSIVLAVTGIVAAATVDGIARVALIWFGLMNVLLAVFNLLPAFPLDGGRIYQAWRWSRSGDRDAATQQAARLGRAVGGLLVLIGALEAMAGEIVGGLWMMLIGWFLREAARAEARHTVLEAPLHAVSVAQIMSPDPESVLGSVELDSFIAGVFFGGRHAAYPVVDEAGTPTGLVTLNAVRAVPYADLGARRVDDVAVPLANIAVVGPRDSVAALNQQLGGRGDVRALVLDQGRLVGIVSPSDLARLIAVVELSSPFGHRDPTGV